jgi:hypothetical protein
MQEEEEYSSGEEEGQEGEQAPEQPTMLVEVELKCENCGKIKKIEVPVVCDVEVAEGKEELVCDISEEVELPTCECGGKFKKIVKKDIRGYR